jgi:hypothetical protein
VLLSEEPGPYCETHAEEEGSEVRKLCLAAVEDAESILKVMPRSPRIAAEEGCFSVVRQLCSAVIEDARPRLKN